MTADFSRFAFNGVEHPHAATLTEALTWGPADKGYIVVTLKTGRGEAFAETARAYVKALRDGATSTGLTDVLAFRQARPDEYGAGVPFDQAICDQAFADVRGRREQHGDRWPATRMAAQLLDGNPIADWVLLLEYATTDQAAAAARAPQDAAFAALTRGVEQHGVSASRNMMRYANVSRDPDLLQFFNLFPGPGDPMVLWQGWQEALPWFFEVGEVRSSYPLVALDDKQPLLIVNYAHFDSLKHFYLGVAFDPNFMETIMRCYADRGFHLPLPFFCKIVPV